MNLAWFRQFAQSLYTAAPSALAAPRPQLRVTELEDRSTPATITWVGTVSGSWHTAGNWLDDIGVSRLPGAGDDVVIPDIGNNGANLTITFNTGTTTVQSITSAENFTFSGGTLEFSGGTRTFSAAGTTVLFPNVNNGTSTFRNGVIASGTTVSVSGNTTNNFTGTVFENATIAGTVVLPSIFGGGGNRMRIDGDLTLHGTITGGNAASIDFNAAAGATQTVSGTGTISVAGAVVRQVNNSHTVAFGAGVTVQSTGAFSLGFHGNIFGPFGTWTNAGTWRAATGGTFELHPSNTFQNLPGGVWAADGGTFTTGGTWDNDGTIRVTAGTLNLGGAFTPATLGAVARTGGTAGTVNITGALTNTGNTITLDATTGTWRVAGGTIVGGTITASAAAPLVFARGTTSTLNGVTLNGPASVEGAFSGGAGNVIVLGDLTVNGTLDMQSESRLRFSAAAGVTQRLLGTGTVYLRGGVGFDNELVQEGGAHTVETYARVESTGGSRARIAAGTWRNFGTWTAVTGGALPLVGGTYTNEPGGVWAADGGTFTTGGTWDNNGTLRVTAGTLNLGGGFDTDDIGTFARTGGTAGTVNITGTLTNTGSTLALDAATGTWRVAGGTIAGGTVDSSGGARLEFAAGNNSTLNGVTLNGPAHAFGGFSGGAANVFVVGDLTVNGAFTLATEVLLRFSGAAGTTQRLLGAGTLTFQGQFGFPSAMQQDGAAHTVETYANISVIGAGFRIGDGSLPGTWRNFGTWRTPTGGGLELRSGGTYVNESGGTWEAAGGTFTTGGTWDNNGTVAVSAGTLNLGGTFATADIGTFTRTGGTVRLTGTLTNTGNTLTLGPASGSWVLAGGTITGGTITTDTTNILSMTGDTNSRLSGVTVSAGSTVVVTSGSAFPLTIDGGFTLNGTLQVGNDSGTAGQVRFGPMTVGGTGTIQFGNAASNTVGTTGSTTAVTVGPGVTIRGRTGLFDSDGVASSAATWRFEGPTVVDAGGTGLRIHPRVGHFQQAGTVTIPTGTAFTIDAANWSNTGAITVAGGTINLGGNFTPLGLGNVTRTGGTVNLTGTLTGDLTLNDTLGNWNLLGGALRNGTFRVSAGSSARLIATTTNSFLDGVTLASALDLTAVPNSTVTARNGLTINVSQAIGATSGATTLRFEGSQTLGGTGELVFGSVFDGVRLVQTADGQVLTIGQGFTIRGTAGSIGTVGGTLVNKGTIRRDSGAGQFSLTFGVNGRNEGLIDTTATSTATGSRTLVSGGSTRTWTNLGTIRNSGVTLVGVQLDEVWTNLGTIEHFGGVVEFAGQFTQAGVGYFTRAAGAVVRLGANATLTGDLTLDDTTGSWDLAGATLQNGTLRTSGSARLIARTATNSLIQYTVNGQLDLTQENTTLNVTGGLTVNTVLTVGSPTGSASTSFNIRDNQTWGGTGTIVFGNSTANTITTGVTRGLTLAAGLTLRGKNLLVNNLPYLINYGTLAADVSGGLFDLNPVSFTNLGATRAANGAEVRLRPSSTTGLTNLAGQTLSGSTYSATLTGGEWSVGASGTLRLYYNTTTDVRLTGLAAALTLDGGNSNVFGGAPATAFASSDALSSLAVVTGDGSLTLSNGRTLIRNAPTLTTAGSITVGAGSTLGAVAPAQLPVAAGLANTYIAEGNTADGTGPNTGTAEGSLTYVTGRTGVGQAFQFNGSNTGVALGAFTRQSFTIGMWVRPGGTQVQYADIFDNNHTSTTNFVLQQDVGNTNRYIWFAADGSANATFTLAADQWQYLVVTRDAATRANRVYVNGVLVGSSTGTGNINYVNPFLRLGRWGGGGRNWNGAMDDVHIYDRALSAAEIAQNYAAPSFVPSSITQTGGTLAVHGQLFSGGAGTVNLAGGTLRGTGTINGSVVNTGGTIAPGSSPGFLDITGNYTQGPGATLELEIAGRNPNTPEFDRLRVTGTATLDGTLRAVLLDGFEPTPGDNYQVLSSALLTVQPGLRYELPAPGGANRRLAPIVGSTTLTFQAQQLPPVNFGFADVSPFAQPIDVATDRAGNAYVVGRDLLSAYVTKQDPNGTVVWTRRLNNVASAFPNVGSGVIPAAIAIRDDDFGDLRVHVTGSYFGRIEDEFGTFFLDQGAIPVNQTFLFSLDGDGTPFELAGLDGGVSYGLDIAVGGGGTVYVVGSMSGTVDFDPGPGTLTRTATADANYVWAYTNSTGVVEAADLVEWDDGNPGATTAQTAGIAVRPDPLGSLPGDTVWVVGTFQGNMTGLATLSSAFGSVDAYVLRLTPGSGAFTTDFATTYGAEGEDRAGTVAVDPSGNAIVGGSFQFSTDFDVSPNRAFTLRTTDTDGFLLKLGASGEFAWARQIGGYREDSVNGVATDAAGNVYHTGQFSDTVDFDPLLGSYLLTTDGVQGYLSRLNADGSFGWAVTPTPAVSTPGQFYGLGLEVAVSSVGNIYSTGQATGDADFDPSDGTQLRGLMGGGGYQYLWGLTQKPAPVAAIAGLPGGALTEGDTLALAASVTDADSAYFTYSWTVTRGGVTVATGSGPALALRLADQGIYSVTLVVTDESGNTDTTTATVGATNAAPVLNATTFGPVAALAAPIAPAPAVGDALGTVLATGGGFILSGAPLQDVSGQADAGAVRVYDSAGAFVRTLLAPAAVAGQQFGGSVAVVGQYAVVGAAGPAAATGSVFVFDLATGGLVRTITGPGAVAGDRFGAAVAAVGTFVAVGAPGRTADGATATGAAYLFDPATGTRLATYRNPTPQASDAFGTAVVAVGGNLLIGAPGDDSAGLDAGAAYLFDVGTGRALRTVTNPNPTFAGSNFGGVLAASGTRAAVGAPLDDSAGTDAGGAFLYDLDPSSDTFGTLLRTVRSPNASPNGGRFGGALAFVGNRLLVGADGDGTTTANSGSAFLIDAEPTSATFGGNVRTFKKVTPVGADRYGSAVAFVGDDVLVGASADDTSAADAGRLYRANATAFVTLSAASVSENGTLTVSGSFSDAGSSDPHVAVITWGNGDITRVPMPAGVATFTAEYRYLDDDPTGTASDIYAVRVSVQDDTTDLLVTELVAGPTDDVNRYDAATGAFLGRLYTTTDTNVGDALAKPIAGPDGLLYVQLGGDIRRRDPVTGADLGVFASLPNNSAYSRPMAFGPDGTLYAILTTFSPTEAVRVVRFDRTGQPVAAPGGGVPSSIFRDSGAGGLATSAAGLALSDGVLYVADVGNLYKYDLATGAPLGTVFTAAAGYEFIRDLTPGGDGTIYAITGQGVTTTVVRFDLATGEAIQQYVPQVAAGQYSNFQLVGADELYLTYVTNGVGGVGRVDRFSRSTGEQLGTFPLGSAALGAATVASQDVTSATVTVNNVAPGLVVRAAANGPAAPAGSFTLSAEVSDPGTRDTFTYLWAVTGGTVHGGLTGPTLNFTPTAVAVRVTLAVTDDDTGTVSSTVQVLFGTAAADTITLTNTQYQFGAAAAVNYTAGTGRVIVYGLAGNDLITAAGVTNAALAVELVGGAGADSLVGGAGADWLLGDSPGGYGTSFATATDDRSPDSLAGGSGNDSLDAGLGDDTMAGGTGNDYYRQVPGSHDLLTEAGASGTDTIDYGLAYSGITFTLGKTDVAQPVSVTPNTTTVNLVTIQGTFENLFGGAYADKLSGNELPNVISGGDGADEIYGDARDLDFGGTRLDSLAAVTGDGNDTLAGGGGNDTVTGGSGNDIIFGGEVRTSLPGTVAPVAPPPGTGTEPDNNSLVGGTGNDTVVGGSGNDIIFGGETQPVLYPGLPLFPGAPTVPQGVPDNNSLVGGTGNDTVVGGRGNDIIFGGEVDISLPGTVQPTPTQPEQNTLIGGQGSDTVVGGRGNDIIFGGEVAISLPGAPAPSPPAPDTAPNSLVGGQGNDTVVGGQGNDIIFGGEVRTSLDGTSSTPTQPEQNTLIGGQGSDTVVGGRGNDIIFGGEVAISLAGTVQPPAPPVADTGSNSLVGGSGNDTIVGGSGNDIIFGGEVGTSLPGSPAPSSVGSGLGDDNTIVGGQGSDTVVGGRGNDIIFGGEVAISLAGTVQPPAPPVADTGSNSLVGGSGNDTVVGGSGNDIIFGGEVGTSLPGSPAPSSVGSGLGDDNTIVGGQGSDTVVGGRGNDIIFGGEVAISLAGTTAPAPSGAPDAANSLVGGTGNDTVVGAAGNDIIFGGEGDDRLTGDAGTDLFEGGSGLDTIAESADADFTVAATQLFITPVTGPATSERFYDIDAVALTGGAGDNRLDATAFLGTATLSGGAGNDTLMGTAFADSLLGGTGNDSLLGGTGADVLDTGDGDDVADGGGGNDTYLLTLAGTVALTDAGGIDSIDLTGTGFGVTADLTAGTLKFTPTGAVLATLGGTFENLRGTPFNDTILGNAAKNILEGGGGNDRLDGGADADTVQGGFPQVVYLDFDSETGPGEHVYTVEERNRIQERLEKAYAAPFSISFSQTPPSVGRFTTLAFNFGEAESLIAGLAHELDWRNVNAASMGEVNVNGFLGRAGQPAATSANYVALTFTVAAHELGHLFGLRHSDSFGPIGSGIYGGLVTRLARDEQAPAVGTGTLLFPGQPAPSPATVHALRRSPVLIAPVTQYGGQTAPFTPPSGIVSDAGTAVATFTVDTAGQVQVQPLGNPPTAVLGGYLDPYTGGLVLRWSATPTAASVLVTYQYDSFRPGYRGPTDAVDTPADLMASPASVGTTLFDAVRVTGFGVRSRIKLAFGDAGATAAETAYPAVAAPPATGATTARDLGVLPGLSVPNLPTVGTDLAQVRATNVTGTIALTGGVSENDVYAFQGRAGEYLTVEVLSFTLRQRIAERIDSVVRVYDATGALLSWFGSPAVNDDGFDNQDALLQDVLLPADGTYYVTVDTYYGGTGPDTDTGGYELFLYTYRPPQAGATRLGGTGDVLTGGPGRDVLVGSAGDDRFDGNLSEDVFIGYIPDQDAEGPVNTAPTATVALGTDAPRTNDLLTATVTVADTENDAVSLTYQWFVNGTPVRTTANTTALTDALDLSAAGNGDRGDAITVVVTATDGTATGEPTSAGATVANTAPTAGNRAVPTAEDTDATVTLHGTDVDGDTVGFVVTSLPANGSLYAGTHRITAAEAAAGYAVSAPLTYRPDRDANGPDSFTYRATDGTALGAAATVSLTVTAVNDAPALMDDTLILGEDTFADADVLANDRPAPLTATDEASQTLTVTKLNGVTVTVGQTVATANGTVTLLANGQVRYTPNPNYNGPDSFTYEATDSGDPAASATASGLVIVNPANDAPTAADGAATTAEDAPVLIDLRELAADAETDDADLTYEIISGPNAAEGMLTATATAGVFTFTPAADFSGTATITYRVTDRGDPDGQPGAAGYSGPLSSAVRAVTITVTPVNDAPVTLPVVVANTPEDTPVSGVLLAYDVDSTGLTFVVVGTPTGGTVSLDNATGAFTFTPAADFSGTASFRFTASDGGLTSGPRTVTITVTPVNDAPVAAAATFGTDEDTAVSGTVSATDVDSTGLSFDVVAGSVFGGTVALDKTTGAFTFTPYADFGGTATFQFTASDGSLTSAAATVTIGVTPRNDAPTAADDAFATAEDTQLVVPAPGVLANDSDVDSPALTAVLVSGPAHGTLALSPNGTLIYTPHENFSGTDTFTYQAYDGHLLSNPATVTLTVLAVNDAPVAAGDSATTAEDTPVVIPVLANDSDVDSPTLLPVVVQQPAHGTVTAHPDGTLTYTPAANYSGPDTFTYRASDGARQSESVTVTITVTPVNDAPVAVSLVGDRVAENRPAGTVVGTLAVTDPDLGDTHTFALVSGTGDTDNGLFAVVGNQLVTTAGFDYESRTSYTVRVRATDAGGLSVERVFTVNVTDENETPTAVILSGATVAENAATGTAIGTLSTTDPDAGDTFTYELLDDAGGRVVLDGDTLRATGAIDFEAAPVLSVTVRATDAGGRTIDRTFVITVTNANEAPTLTDAGPFAVPENTAAVGTVTATDPDAGTTLVYSIVGGADAGEFAIDPNTGALSFVAAPDYEAPTDADGNNVYEVVVAASDGSLTATRLIGVTVTNANEAPTALELSNATVAENAGPNAAVGSLTATDPDAGDVLAFSLPAGVGDNGLFNLDGGTLRANAGFDYEARSSYTVTVRVTDAGGLSYDRTVTVAVTNVNEAPVAADQSLTTAEDTAVSGAVTATDVDSAGLTFAVVGTPTGGTVSLDNATGAFTFTPAADFSGTASFRFTASDGGLTSGPRTVTITVTPVNDAPVANNDTFTTAEDTPLTVSAPGVRGNDVDVDSPTPTVVLVSGPANGSVSLNASGQFVYTPNANYHGTDTFTYKLNDGQLDSNTATVTVTVTPVNDAPTATPLSVTTPEDTSTLILLAGSDVDAGTTLRYVITSLPTRGLLYDGDRLITAAEAAAGYPLLATLLYVPTPNANGTDGFTYVASDGQLSGAPAAVSITVTAVNDAPVAATDSYAVARNGVLTVAAPGVLADDSDADSPTLTAVLVSGPTHGTLTLNANGSFTYTPTAGYVGTDSFTYKANDGQLDSNVVTVSLTVTGTDGTVSVQPTATTAAVNGAATIAAAAVLAGATDTAGGTLAVAGHTQGANGTVGYNAATGTFTYTPAAGFTGADSFSVTVTNGTSSAVATVYVLVGGQAFLLNGNLIVVGSGAGDDIDLTKSGTSVRVEINYNTVGTFAVTGAIRVFGGAGNDSITVESCIVLPAELYGEAGNDTLRAGGGNDLLVGGAGNDSLQAVTGDDRLDGGTGNDTLRAGAGVDLLFGGDGNDSLVGATGDDTLSGGAGNDTLRGGSGRDVLSGGTGNDVLYAGSGDDYLDGGDGNDELFGGSGSDTLIGGKGNDELQAGGGSDLLQGGDGNDILRAGSGADSLDGGTGNDTLHGGSGADSLLGGAGDDVIRGGSGDDIIFGGDGNDDIDGGSGDDFLDGGTGNDCIDGGEGTDILLGGAGCDVLIGGSGRDLIIGGFGADIAVGNSGDDILIAGTTAYDSDPAKLNAIRSVWNGNGSYDQRVAALQSASFTARLFVSGTNGTVFDDNATDQLTGSSGTDWFIANTEGPGARDRITDQSRSETDNDT